MTNCGEVSHTQKQRIGSRESIGPAKTVSGTLETVSWKTTSSRGGYEKTKLIDRHVSFDVLSTSLFPSRGDSFDLARAPYSLTLYSSHFLITFNTHYNRRLLPLHMEEIHKTSSSTRLYDDEKLPPREIPWIRRHPYRTLGTVAGTIALLGITLGVGLNVGLTNSEDAPESTPTMVSAKRSAPPVASASPASVCKPGVPSVLGGVNVYANNTPLWQPLPGTPWQIVLSSPVNAWKPMVPALSIYDIDMYGNNALNIQQMHLQGIKVICYFSAGSWEVWRPDAGLFPPQDLGRDLSGWPGERWVNTDSKSVRNIMAERIRLAAEKGCDAVDPDNMDGFVGSYPSSNISAMLKLNRRRPTQVSRSMQIPHSTISPSSP